MSKMGEELDRKLSENKYEMLETLLIIRDQAVLHKQENGFYLLRLDYASWQNMCTLIAKIEEK